MLHAMYTAQSSRPGFYYWPLLLALYSQWMCLSTEPDNIQTGHIIEILKAHSEFLLRHCTNLHWVLLLTLLHTRDSRKSSLIHLLADLQCLVFLQKWKENTSVQKAVTTEKRWKVIYIVYANSIVHFLKNGDVMVSLIISIFCCIFAMLKGVALTCYSALIPICHW